MSGTTVSNRRKVVLAPKPSPWPFPECQENETGPHPNGQVSKLMSNSSLYNDGSPIMSTFVNRNGLRIMTFSWKVSKPKRAVCIVHGLQGHCRFEFLDKEKFRRNFLKKT
eukprot:GHVT01011193.1.p2 GENE.GHVT01011193.1~~GHVT01011193.1.p2  ORF type:complete len:110 (+),score=5.20 GHVT01011193.1:680-1009(+)